MGYHFLPQGIFPTQDQTRISCLSGRLFSTEPGKVQGLRHKQISCGQQLILCCKYYNAAATAAKSLQSCPTLCDPIAGGPQAPPSLGFSRQEHWSGLPFPSPMHEREKWKWSRSVVSDSSRPHGLQPTRLLHPWDFPGKSTGVGCHCLLHWKVQVMSKNIYKGKYYNNLHVVNLHSLWNLNSYNC